ncbi:MAG: MTH1187 family thiamine-binding protein [Hadesarchaea archaeon]|nr:MTH1187 family thiamine-binding protein [Hadesarchaea archaeon]
MAIMEISIVPVGTGTASVSKYIAAAVKVLESRGVKYQLTAMGTIVEGETGELLRLAQEMQEAVFRMGVSRIVTKINLDERRDKKMTMETKVESVREKMK